MPYYSNFLDNEKSSLVPSYVVVIDVVVADFSTFLEHFGTLRKILEFYGTLLNILEYF